MKTPIEVLRDSGYKVYHSNTSALDRYFRVPSGPSFYLLTDCSLINLAETEDLEYPGLVYEEALVRRVKKRYLFRCYDEDVVPPPRPFTVQELLYDPDRGVFLDPLDVYPDLRKAQLIRQMGGSSLLYLTEAAVLVFDRIGIENGLFNIFECDQTYKLVLPIHHRKLFNPVPMK